MRSFDLLPPLPFTWRRPSHRLYLSPPPRLHSQIPPHPPHSHPFSYPPRPPPPSYIYPPACLYRAPTFPASLAPPPPRSEDIPSSELNSLSSIIPTSSLLPLVPGGVTHDPKGSCTSKSILLPIYSYLLSDRACADLTGPLYSPLT